MLMGDHQPHTRRLTRAIWYLTGHNFLKRFTNPYSIKHGSLILGNYPLGLGQPDCPNPHRVTLRASEKQTEEVQLCNRGALGQTGSDTGRGRVAKTGVRIPSTTLGAGIYK